MVTYGKRHGLVHRKELNGVVQEEEIGVVAGVPFHLADQRLLALAIHRAGGPAHRAGGARARAHPIPRAAECVVMIE